jgi:hypothetical protein
LTEATGPLLENLFVYGVVGHSNSFSFEYVGCLACPRLPQAEKFRAMNLCRTVGYQPMVPAAPLNGPTIFSVIQPP